MTPRRECPIPSCAMCELRVLIEVDKWAAYADQRFGDAHRYRQLVWSIDDFLRDDAP